MALLAQDMLDHQRALAVFADHDGVGRAALRPRLGLQVLPAGPTRGEERAVRRAKAQPVGVHGPAGSGKSSGGSAGLDPVASASGPMGLGQ